MCASGALLAGKQLHSFISMKDMDFFLQGHE